MVCVCVRLSVLAVSGAESLSDSRSARECKRHIDNVKAESSNNSNDFAHRAGQLQIGRPLSATREAISILDSRDLDDAATEGAV